MKIFFKGFNFSQDGPGNRLVYHLQGCNMRCPWCSNPEGMSHLGGEEYSVTDIVRECERCRPMFFSGGGVTFTGGEATLQCDELIAVLSSLRERNIHTALETNGTSTRLPEIQKHVDYLIMDIKHYDTEAHRRYTGLGMETVLSNYKYLCSIRRQLHIRIPVINHVNSDGVRELARLLSSYNTERCVFEFLPYHEYGKEKWKSEYTVKDGFVTDEDIKRFEKTFSEHKLRTVHT